MNDADVFTGVDLESINLLRIVVFGLILKMRSEDTLLEKRCISLPFQPPSILFVIENYRRKIPNYGYLCMLIDYEVYSIVTYSLTEN